MISNLPSSYSGSFEADSLCCNEVNIQGRKITYVGKDKQHTHVFGDTPVHRKSSFTIKIAKTKSKTISFGVIDLVEKKKNKLAEISFPKIIKFTSKGLKNSQIKGFEEGDSIRATISLD